MFLDTSKPLTRTVSPAALTLPGTEIRQQVKSGIITWMPVVILLLGRTVFWFSMQALVAMIFLLQGSPSPWNESIKWYSIYGNGNDIACLILLYLFLKKEGRRIPDLLRAPRNLFWKDVLLGVGLFIMSFPITVIAWGILASLLVYGIAQPVVGVGTLTARQLPLWAVIYSLVFWWVINSPTELDFVHPLAE